MGDLITSGGGRPHCMWCGGKTVSDVVNCIAGGGRRLHQSGEGGKTALQVVGKTALRQERIIGEGEKISFA